MFVNHLDVSGNNRLSQLLHTLKHVHEFEFGAVDHESLLETQKTFEELKQQIVETSAFNSYYKDPNYTKAALITEAVRMLLEISPKRKRKKTVESTEEFKDPNMKKLNEKSSGRKPDFLDVDKDGNKTEPMSKALKDKAAKKKSLKEEQNLDQAQTLLAAKDLSDQLQNMAEDAAKMSVDDLMPLVDTMKAQFGQEQANAFNEVVKQNLQGVLDSIIKAKDETDNAIMALQGGQTPTATSDISQPLPGAEPAAEPGAEDFGAEPDFAATPSASGPEEEPLGRASKRDLDEARKKCMECGTGVYETHKPGHMVCNNCGSKMVAEAWDTKMKTAKKDIGKWEGYTISELKARKKKLMSKEERSAKEQKEVRQINFAIRAKQENHWGKIKEQQVNEAANGKPTSEKEKKLAAMAPPKDKITRADVLKGRGVIEEGKCPECHKKPCVCEAVNETEESSTAKLAMMAVTGKDDKGKPLTSTQKAAAKKASDELTKAKLAEKLTKSMSAGEIISDFVHSDDPKFKGKSKAERTKMALGAYYGMHPEKSKKEESQIAKCNALLEALAQKLEVLNTQFSAHKRDFKKQISEGKQIDPLNLGYGLAGDAIKHKINEVKKQISEAEALKSRMMSHLKQRKQTISETKREIETLDQQLGSTPFGVVGINTAGKRTSKFFESAEQRSIWLEFHKDTLTEHQLIDPDLISKAQNYLKKRIKG